MAKRLVAAVVFTGLIASACGSAKPEGPFVYRTEDGVKFIENHETETLKSWPIPYKEHFVPTSFGKTYVIEFGTEGLPELVALHGMSTNSSLWVDFVDLKEMAGKYHVFAVDIIGDAGKSILEKKQEDPAFYTEWLKEVFDELGIEKPYMAGVSFGGSISMLMAYHHSELIKGAIAMSPVLVMSDMPFWSGMRMMWAFWFFTKERHVAFLLYTNGDKDLPPKAKRLVDFTFDVAGYTEELALVIPEPFSEEQIEAIKVPVICYLGALDPFFDAKEIEESVAPMKSKIEIHVVEGEGHYMGFDLLPLINQGIGEIDASGGPKSQ